jgi:hypothetical protein
VADTEAEIYAATRDYEKALDSIRKGKAGNGNAGLEGRLGQAYQRLVRVGAKPQIKLKYRGR